MRGQFIVFDGGEGGGKTTNIEFAKGLLEEQGVEVVVTREPGGTPMAEELRNMLLMPRDETVHETTELLLMFAARAQHIEEVIKPALARGAWVISDRFTSASKSYQGYGRGIDLDKISMLESLVQDAFRPDMTFILDLDPEIGIARARLRAFLDRIEQEHMSFFYRVREGFLRQAEAEPDRFRVIDASMELDAVQAQIRDTMAGYLPELMRVNRPQAVEGASL